MDSPPDSDVAIIFDAIAQKYNLTDTQRAHLDEYAYNLAFSVRTENCLKNDNIIYIGDLVQKEERELLDLDNFGRACLENVRGQLGSLGLHLGMTLGDQPTLRAKWPTVRRADRPHAEALYENVVALFQKAGVPVTESGSLPAGFAPGARALVRKALLLIQKAG